MYEQYVARAVPEHPRQSEASMVSLKDGTLLLAYTDFYAGNLFDDAPAQIMAKISENGGKTWSEPFQIQENIGRLNGMSASLLRLKSGRIMLSFHRKDTSETECHIMAKISEDECRTWSKPAQVTEGMYFFCGTNDRLVQMSDGRILMPMGYWVNSKCYVFCYYSDDEGKTWKMSARATHEAGAYEPVVVELSNSTVLMLIRNRSGQILKSYSNDRGETWSMPESLGLSSPPSPCNCKRLPDGNLLLVWNNSRNERLPITTAISRDEGLTWHCIRDMDGTDNTQGAILKTYAYPSILAVDDVVHITYWECEETYPRDASNWREALRAFHLKYCCVSLDWFYEKETQMKELNGKGILQ